MSYIKKSGCGSKSSKNQLIKTFHTLLHQYGISADGKESLLGSYGVESSVELTCEQLVQLNNFIREMGSPMQRAAEKQRTRLIGSIIRMCEACGAAGFEALGGVDKVDYAKRVACRAAGLSRRGADGRDNFGKIGIDRMRSLTYAFDKRTKDMESVVETVKEMM